MSSTSSPTNNYHGPENAEHELRKAFNAVMEAKTACPPGNSTSLAIKPEELDFFYKKAYQAFRKGDRLAAERWARATKHLARAYWHEAKLVYLHAHSNELPFLQGATAEELGLREHSDTTEDLLNSLEFHTPTVPGELPHEMKRFLGRGRKHLERLSAQPMRFELERAERIQTAHEYGRVVECMALALEAESPGKQVA